MERDTAWIMAATALVLFMTLPGLRCFMGLVCQKRFERVYALLCDYCLMSVLWFALGYSIAFGNGSGLGRI